MNGKLDAGLELDDRGLHYGDGLFETIAFPFSDIIPLAHPLLPYHLDRLKLGCEKLCLNVDIKDLLERFNQLQRPFTQSIVKIIITRKAGGRGYQPASNDTNIFMTVNPWPKTLPKTIHAAKSSVILAEQPRLAGIKHLNRLENVLASMELSNNTQEVLMCDRLGHVIEGTKSNLFALFDETWVTPKLDHCGVKGVMRSWLLDKLPSQGLYVQEDTIAYNDLFKAKALFICNSVLGVKAIHALDGRPMPLDRLEPIQHMADKLYS